MAHAILWPSAVPTDAPASSPSLLAGLDTDGFAAGFGPDFSRLAGFRVGALAAPDRPVSPLVVAARLKLGPAPTRIDLLIDVAGAASLLERLFGAQPGEAATELPVLPPSSASWLCLCRLLAAAAGRALAACGMGPGGSPELPPRAMPAPSDSAGPAIQLQTGGTRILLLLADPDHRTAPPPPPGDPELWRRRARARALDVELPVTLRLADRRMGVGEVAALLPGDVLPLDTPHAVDVLVAGHRLGKARLDEGGSA